MKTNVPLKNVHVVGHSLGGQTAGFVGKEIINLTNGRRIKRISALDPAGPQFEFNVHSERLNESDAEIVVVVHTDNGLFGMNKKIGKVDFYPNGGFVQPDCGKFNISILRPSDINQEMMRRRKFVFCFRAKFNCSMIF